MKTGRAQFSLRWTTACALLLAGFASARAGVSITTWQADLQHTGQNLRETRLTPNGVGSIKEFGFRFSQPVDGQVYGQPLLVSGVTVGGALHDIVYLATEHDSVYAFDANDNLGRNESPLWQKSLLPPGSRPVSQSITGSADISVEVGITATPVIDLSSRTLYVVSKIQTGPGTFEQHLHALDLSTGAEKFGDPALINPTFAGSAIEGSNGVIPFNPLREHSRAALILSGGIVYVTYGSLSDGNPYHGEILGYDASSLKLVKKFISTPNGTESGGGIWQAGAGPAVDDEGNLYVATSNGLWDQAASAFTKSTNWGESVLKLPTSAGAAFAAIFSDPSTWFTPNNWQQLNREDLDLGSSGLLLLPDQAQGPCPHLAVIGGKGGVLYVLNRDHLGGMHAPDAVVQNVNQIHHHALFATPAYFNGNIYYATVDGPLEQRAFGYQADSGNYISPVPIISSNTYAGKGAGVFISANGTRQGIAWLLNGSGIEAYDARNVSGPPIYSAKAIAPPGFPCRTTKFSLPIVANGKVYFTAFDKNNTGHLFVLGLLSSQSFPDAPSGLAAEPVSSHQITLTWNQTSQPTRGFALSRALSPEGPFQTVQTLGPDVTTVTDSGLGANTAYFYKITAVGARGVSDAATVVSASTFPFFSARGLVAFWDMDEDSSGLVLDITGNDHNGKVRGEVGAEDAVINGAYTFHGTGGGDAHIAVPNAPELQFRADQSFTLAAWIKPVHLGPSEQAVLTKSPGTGNAYGLWISAKGRWIFRGPGADLIGPAAREGMWTHVSLVQDAAARARRMYVDGRLVASTPSVQPADGLGDFWMGQQNVTDAPETFSGVIDEVRIYNRALDPSEITDLLGPPILAVALVQPDLEKTPRAAPAPVSPEEKLTAKPGDADFVLYFASPVSGITARLGAPNESATVAGKISGIAYDSSGKVVRIHVTSLGAAQAVQLNLADIQPGKGTTSIRFDAAP